MEAASLSRLDCARSSRSLDAEFRVKVSPRVPRESDISLTFVRNPFRFARQIRRIFCDHVRGSQRAAISRQRFQRQEAVGRPFDIEGGRRGADRDRDPSYCERIRLRIRYLSCPLGNRSKVGLASPSRVRIRGKKKRRKEKRKNSSDSFSIELDLDR